MRFCPFGKDCFYQHLNDDGTEYVFVKGVDECMKVCVFKENFGPTLSVTSASVDTAFGR
jgi:hypothetical protein